MSITRGASLLIAWLLCGALLEAQPENAVADRGAISGVVVDAVSGEPLGKARVGLRKLEGRASPLLGTSDSTGRFVLQNIEPGRYRLYVQRNRYVAQEYGQRSPSRPGTVLNVQAGQHIKDLAVALTRAAVITGRVVDEDNEPLERASVSAMGFRYVEGRKQLVRLGGGATDDLGEYRVFGLNPGRYFIAVVRTSGPRFPGGLGRRGSRGAFSEDNETYVPTYYPGASNPEQAVPLQVDAGGELAGIDIQMRRFQTVKIAGQIINGETGGPSQRNTAVLLVPRNSAVASFETINRTTVRNANGEFALTGVMPGSYTLIAQTVSRGLRSYGRMPVEVGDRDHTDLLVAIKPGVGIDGVVHVEGDADLDLSQLRITLQPRESVVFGRLGGAGRVGADGTFELNNVADTVYNVLLSGAPEDHYLKSARFAEREVLTEGLDLTSGAAPGLLELHVSPRGGRIDGVVVNEEKQAFSAAQVVLVPGDWRRRERIQAKNTTTDQSGVFTLRGVPPGKYSLFAWEDVEPGAWNDPDFLSIYDDLGTPFEIEEGSALSPELELIPATGDSRR